MARMTRKTITKRESKACKRPAGCGTVLKEGRHCSNAEEVKREQNLRSWSSTEERCEQEIPSLHARSPLHLNMCLCSPTRPWLLTHTNEHVLLTGSRALQQSDQDTRALSISFTMHPGLKTPHRAVSPGIPLPCNCRACQIKPRPLQKPTHCVSPWRPARLLPCRVAAVPPPRGCPGGDAAAPPRRWHRRTCTAQGHEGEDGDPPAGRHVSSAACCHRIPWRTGEN